ncbi:MAG: DUF4432 family protein [Eubacteriales bacterium]|nr:DUF4432 family protein [Eubacteriales bacterium]
MDESTFISLNKTMFDSKESVIAEKGALKASAFIFGSGVHGLRITNKCGNVVFLPYQGQQIWSLEFSGHELQMKSMFTEPVATREYLETYGGFLLHCGATAMGVPSAEDSHPLHGELPNAPYSRAYLVSGCDGKGSYLALGGEYRYTKAFNCSYTAEPLAKVYEDSTVLDIAMAITNLRRTAMEYMYMMHINFRPADCGRLVYSAKCDPEHVRVHINIPEHMKAAGGTGKLEEFMGKLAQDPSLHNTIDPEDIYDPEIVFTVLYESDKNGEAHCMQVLPDGYACYVAHRPSELPFGVRWISRTADEDALGMVLPATAEHKGYTEEKRKGHIGSIPGGEKVTFNVRAGMLKPEEAANMEKKIKRITESTV